MTTSTSSSHHVKRSCSKDHLCPVCEKDHGCVFFLDDQGTPQTLICARQKTAPDPSVPGLEFRRDGGTGGVFAVVAPELVTVPSAGHMPPAPTRDWAEAYASLAAAMTSERRNELAGQLGVGPATLDRVPVGWASATQLAELRVGGDGWADSPPDGAYAFQEVDGDRRIIGISYRDISGRKGFARGGQRGLYLPLDFDELTGLTYVVEGASDVLACLEMGMRVIGRPSNSGGADLIAELCKDQDVVIVGENDRKDNGRWPGLDGARRVARRVRRQSKGDVVYALPPEGSKDVRDYLASAKSAGVDPIEAGRELRESMRAAASIDFRKRPTWVDRSQAGHDHQAGLLRAINATRRLYSDGEKVLVEASGGLHPVRPDNFGVTADALIDVLRWKQDDQGNWQLGYAKLPKDWCRALASSPWFLAGMRQVELVTATPVLTREGELIDAPGYHPRAKVYYEGSRIEPTTGTHHIDRVLHTVMFRRPSDRAAAIAFMLTVLLKLWFPGRKPSLAIVANQAGAGKTTLFRVIAGLDGDRYAVTAFTPRSGELEKQLATEYDAGSQAVLIDNLRTTGPFEDTVLESLLTSERYRLRRLGANALIEGVNYPLLAVSLNDNTFGPDLASRQVWCELFFDGDPHERPLPDFGDPVEWVKTHREAMLAELLGMVQRWLDAGRPLADARGCRYREWAQVIGGMLHANGVEGFLVDHRTDAWSRSDQDTALDSLATHTPDRHLSAKAWVEVAQELNLWPEITESKARGAASRKMSAKLEQHRGQVIRTSDESGRVVVYRLVAGSDGRAKTFAFITESDSPTPDVGALNDSPEHDRHDENPDGARDLTGSESLAGVSQGLSQRRKHMFPFDLRTKLRDLRKKPTSGTVWGVAVADPGKRCSRGRRFSQLSQKRTQAK